MKLDEFEKQQAEKAAKKESTAMVRYGSGQAGSAQGTAHSRIDQWELEAQELIDAYMFMGTGGMSERRDHFGFRLANKHKDKNEKLDL